MRDGLSVQRNKGGKRPHDVSSSSRAARGADGTRGARKSLGTEQALRTGVASVSLGGVGDNADHSKGGTTVKTPHAAASFRPTSLPFVRGDPLCPAGRQIPGGPDGCKESTRMTAGEKKHTRV